MTEKPRRADAGTVRATERDVLALSWVVEMYGMPLDLLRTLAGGMGDSAARNMLARWRRAGWVENAQLGAGGMWVWATKLGIEQFGRYPYEPHRPSAAKVPHHRAVIAVRQHIERQRAAKYPDWESEREMRYELGRRRGSDAQREHLVDGIAEFDANDGRRARLGIEVELSPKPIAQLKRNMVNGLDQCQQVAWYVTDRTRALVERAREESGAGQRVAIRNVPEEGVLE